MQKLKRILCAVLAYALFSPHAVLAAAQESSYYSDAPIKAEIRLFDDESDNNEGTENPAPPSEEEAEIIKLIAEGIKNHSKDIDIPDEYTVTAKRFGELYSGFAGYYMQLECPDIIDMPSVMLNGNTDKITGLQCEYTMTEEEYNEAQMAIYCELDKIKELLNDGMSDVEKVLCVHDYIASNYEYDMRIYSNDTDIREQASRNLDTMIAQKTGVCEGYTKLFKFVMDKIGIECVTVPSDKNAHIWNKVKINDKWYNIDVTSDDATPNMSSNILHEAFLVSDSALLKMNDNLHSAWNALKWDGRTPCEVADSTDFDNMLVKKAKGPVVYKDGKWYAIGGQTNYIKSYDVNANTAEEVYTASGDYAWFVYGTNNVTWEGAHSSLALFDGNIYFTAPDKVYEFNPNTRTATEIYNFEKENPDKTDISKSYIYGLKIGEDALYAEYSTRPFYTEDENKNIIDPIPATLLEIVKKEQPCSYEYKDNEDGTIEITFQIPYKYQSVSNIFIAQYADNKYIGMAPKTVTENKMCISPDEECKEIKVLIWNKGNNEPYITSTSHTR